MNENFKEAKLGARVRHNILMPASFQFLTCDVNEWLIEMNYNLSKANIIS